MEAPTLLILIIDLHWTPIRRFGDLFACLSLSVTEKRDNECCKMQTELDDFAATGYG